MDFLEQQVLQQLEGGQAKTDIELLSDLAITRAEIRKTMDKLVSQHVVQAKSPEGAPEIIYTLRKRPKELRSSAFAAKVREAGFSG